MAKGGMRRLKAVLPWLLVTAGLVLLARPVATDWMYAWEAQRDISEITSVYSSMTDPERLENIRQAEAYNAMARGDDPGLELWDYRQQLTYHSTPKSMMAWLEVPKIAVKLPIYHGTAPEVLAAGVGHCEWSSLPIGGQGTHCVLTAHSGLDRTRMFDDIRKLEEGDVFTLWTLGEPRAYRVCSVQVILPEEADQLRPAAAGDYCSLVTCTPIGVNSHRLVVTGERCEYVPDEAGAVEDVAAYVNDRTLPFMGGVAAVAAAAVLLAVWGSRRKRMR